MNARIICEKNVVRGLAKNRLGIFNERPVSGIWGLRASSAKTARVCKYGTGSLFGVSYLWCTHLWSLIHVTVAKRLWRIRFRIPEPSQILRKIKTFNIEYKPLGLNGWGCQMSTIRRRRKLLLDVVHEEDGNVPPVDLRVTKMHELVTVSLFYWWGCQTSTIHRRRKLLLNVIHEGDVEIPPVDLRVTKIHELVTASLFRVGQHPGPI